MKFKMTSDIDRLQTEIERLKIAVEELTVLNDLAITASSAMEVNQMLDIVVEKSIKAMHAEQGSIMLVTPQANNPLQTLIRQADKKSRFMNYKVGSHISGWVLKNNAPLIIENLATDPRFNTSETEKKEIRSVLCVPIQFQGKLIGLLTVTNKKNENPFSQEDLRLLSIIAAQSAQLIRNSQLQQEVLEKNRLQQELELARRIQQELLPQTAPEFPMLDIATYFNPAREIGGDFYDFIHLNDRQLGVVQADVSGHGTSAAMIMTMLKGILQAITKEVLSTEQTLKKLNHIFEKSAPPDMFITMIYMIFDAQEKSLQVSNAGHNPPLLYSKEKDTLDFLKMPGCAINVSPDAEYNTHKISLSPGDFIFIYTDGLPESHNKDFEQFGYDRIFELVKENRHADPELMIQRLKSSLSQHVQDISQSDDIAISVLKITG